MCVCIYVCICVTSSGQTKSDTDLKFGTHTPLDLILKRFFFLVFSKNFTWWPLTSKNCSVTWIFLISPWLPCFHFSLPFYTVKNPPLQQSMPYVICKPSLIRKTEGSIFFWFVMLVNEVCKLFCIIKLNVITDSWLNYWIILKSHHLRKNLKSWTQDNKVCITGRILNKLFSIKKMHVRVLYYIVLGFPRTLTGTC